MRLPGSISIMLLIAAPFWSMNPERVYANTVFGLGAQNYSLSQSADNASQSSPRVENGKIAFVSTRNRNGLGNDLYVMNVDGTGLMNVTANPHNRRRFHVQYAFSLLVA